MSNTTDYLKFTHGPAFPCGGEVYSSGLTIRDYFAGQALAGMGTWVPTTDAGYMPDDVIAAKADWAYAQADAMLAAREAQS